MQMQHKSPSRARSGRQIAWLSVAATVVLGALALFLLRLQPVPPAAGAEHAHARGPAEPLAGDPVDARSDLADLRTEQPPLPAKADPNFADYVAALVRLGLETSRAVAANDLPAAEASDCEARRIFAEMLQRIPDLGPKALGLYLDQPVEPTEEAARIGQRVALLCLDAALSKMHAAGRPQQGRAELDTFVSALLAALPGGAWIARDLGRGLLVDKPYLGAAHEAMLLDLGKLAGEGRFAVDIAAALLTTLWHNLEASGLRDRGQMASLALLMLQGGTPSEMLVACRTLLLDPRYRDLAVDFVKNRKDRALAETVAMAAAEGLAAGEALPLIRTMHSLSANVTAALITLGTREPKALHRAYELALADDVGPEFRCELVSGAGFGPAPAGLAVAQQALRNDRALGVRERAMFVLTARAAEAWGEQAIAELLDDTVFANDPNHLAAAVSALSNLENAGLANAIDRLGQRLANLPLRESDRERLRQILARALPRGAPSRPEQQGPEQRGR